MNVTLKQLLEMIDISRTKLWRMVKDNEFPEPDRTNPRKLIWDLTEIEVWNSKLTINRN